MEVDLDPGSCKEAAIAARKLIIRLTLIKAVVMSPFVLLVWLLR